MINADFVMIQQDNDANVNMSGYAIPAPVVEKSNRPRKRKYVGDKSPSAAEEVCVLVMSVFVYKYIYTVGVQAEVGGGGGSQTSHENVNPIQVQEVLCNGDIAQHPYGLTTPGLEQVYP